MGKRSRKRSPGLGGPASGPSTRAERDAARRERGRTRQAAPAGGDAARPRPRPGRPRAEERPPPPWGAFPLTELIIFAGLVLMAWGFLEGVGENGNAKIAAGLAMASIAGMELSVREHVAGFRSHTTLLAGALAIVAIVLLGLVGGVQTLGFLLIAGAMVFAVSFYALRELFKRRSGGLGFR